MFARMTLPPRCKLLRCRLMMPISSRAFFWRMITTPLPNWSAIISPPSVVFSGSSRGAIWRWLMILRRRLSCALTKTSAAFAARRNFPPGFIALPITVSAKRPANERNWSGSTRVELEAEHDPQTVDPALKHDLMHALQLLPLHERSAILLCCQNGLSHDEAARVLEIPLGTVKTNVLRGREKLKKILAEWGPA